MLDSIFPDPDEDVSSLGREIPRNTAAECAFLGAMLIDNKVLDRAQFLEPEHFSDPVNGLIFREARRLISERNIADPITLKTVFEQDGLLKEVGGVAYLTSLASATVAIFNASDYAKVVRATWLQRELISIGRNLACDAYNGDPMKVALEAVGMIDQIATGVIKDTTTTLDAAVDAALDAMEKANGKPPGLSTGFVNLDRRLGGLEPGLVYTLAGRPGSGKSSLGHQIAINVASQRKGGVLELSLEMSATQLGRRALSAVSGVPLFAMKGGNVSQSDASSLVAARKAIRGLPLTIDDAGGQTPRQIAAKCRAVKRKHGLALVMIDHLNLTRPDDGDGKHGPTFAIERAAGVMLQIAKDNDVAVLMLTQLNRGVEGRDDKRPGLPDLRQSGAIEENAYAVGFLYREEYYLQNAPERKEGESDAKFIDREREWVEHRNRVAGKAEVIWAKVRDGEPGTDVLQFDGRTTSFREASS